jgi:type I restriction enzyme R subunit
MVVANKFQTGFDEPLLHTMYVDKKLGGVAAVQTLSRLNRTRRGKTETVVLDFVNEAEEIQEAFQRYYQNTSLEEETDPNKLYDLTTRLHAFEIYTQQDVEDFAAVFFDERKPGELQQPILDRVVHVWLGRGEEQREDFRSTLQSFVRLYGYVAQLIDFVDTELEKEYVFARNLNRKLPKRVGTGLPLGIVDAVDLDSFRIQQTFEGEIELIERDAHLPGVSTDAATKIKESEKAYLSDISSILDETYGLSLTEKDRVRVEEIVREVEEDAGVRAVMAGNNTVSNKRHKVEKVVEDAILAQVHQSLELYKKLSDPQVKRTFKDRLFENLLQRFHRRAS